MQPINVLVFPCGSEVGLEICRSLKDIRFINLYGASSVEDHGAFVYENYIGDLPYLNDEVFFQAFKNLVEENNIDVVFPALDSAIPYFARVCGSLPCKVVGSDLKTALACRDKALTYKTIGKRWFNVKTYDNWDEVNRYPVIIKPAFGQGSQGFKIIPNENELRFELENRKDRQVICEYLPGEEYTIDCFTDRFGNLRYASQRVRGRTKAGISVNSHLKSSDEIVWSIAQEINSSFTFRGVWFFQLKKNIEGEYRLLEIAPRVAGTMCLERAIGVNLPLLSVLDAMDYDVDIMPQFDSCVVDRSLDCVFSVDCDYSEVFLDFDDTLVCDGRVHLPTVSFLYQCANENMPVTLLTRHAYDIHESLRKARISETLFAEIIVLSPEQKKSDFISPSSKAIFIDDSFSERADVYKRLGVKTFGLEALEVLLK